MQRLLTALAIALIALPAADAAAAHVTPSAGGPHAAFTVAARAPIADPLAGHYLAGATATTFFARVVAPHGCAAPASVNATETGTEIAAGEERQGTAVMVVMTHQPVPQSVIDEIVTSTGFVEGRSVTLS